MVGSKKQTGIPGKSDAVTVDGVLETVRKVWDAVERADLADKPNLRKDITQTINRLKGRIEGKIGKPSTIPNERSLFDLSEAPKKTKLISDDSSQPRFNEPALRIYDKDFAEHSLRHLPESADFQSVEEFRGYLSQKLRFNSQATRRRAANYLVGRFFPGDIYHADLPLFAAAATGKSSLGEALFYLTCRAEKIVSLVADEIVFPSLALGGVSRSKIRDFVQSQFPKSKSVEAIGQSIVRTYHAFGIGLPDRVRLKVSLREGSLVSFAYILHLEFPEPGMHTFENMFNGPMHKWLLWDQQWMVRQLYLLRELGLLSKVSEIDRMRQFTTKHTLAQATQSIVALAKESPV